MSQAQKRPNRHIWAKSAQNWMKLDGLVYQTQPEDNYRALIDASAEQQKGR